MLVDVNVEMAVYRSELFLKFGLFADCERYIEVSGGSLASYFLCLF